MIDLHTHSTFSDGSLTPAELVERAQQRGLYALALTDHDTLNGIPAFEEACRSRSFRGIRGVEISVESSAGSIHMLGYMPDPANPELNGALQRIRDGRAERNTQILHKLNSLGMKLTMEEVASYAGSDVVGRPHFAQALLAKGHVKSTRDAFDLYLGKGKAAYCERFRFEPEDAIAFIAGAGGVPVLAHPCTVKLPAGQVKDFVQRLRDVGLQGIEAYYPEHSREQEKAYLALAGELGLLATGGSDFHGTVTPKLELGTGFGGLRVPDEVADRLLERARR